jgi:hypothetical protein
MMKKIPFAQQQQTESQTSLVTSDRCIYIYRGEGREKREEWERTLSIAYINYNNIYIII